MKLAGLLHTTLGLLLVRIYVPEAAELNYIDSSIRNYFSQTRHHTVHADYKARAKEYIFNEFKRFGLQTEYHPFEKNISSRLVSFTNVIGVLEGDHIGTAADNVLGVAAHYDTVATSPGVDDNGSGVVALLEVVRQLTRSGAGGWRRNNTIVFLALDATEQDKAGSDAYVKTWMLRWLVSNYGSQARSVVPHGVIVLDTIMAYNNTPMSQKFDADFNEKFSQVFPTSIQSIQSDGYRGDFLAMVYRQPSLDKKLASKFKEQWTVAGNEDRTRMRFKLHSFPLPFLKLNSSLESKYDVLLQSDHYNLWVDQVPAIYLTDTGHYRGGMSTCFHNDCDDVEHVLTNDNIAFLTKTVDVVAQTVHILSEPSQTAANTASRQATFNYAIAVHLLCVVWMALTFV